MPEVTEEKIQRLMSLWGGKLPHKRAKKKLEWIAEHGCPLLDECLGCPNKDKCPVMDGD